MNGLDAGVELSFLLIQLLQASNKADASTGFQRVKKMLLLCTDIDELRFQCLLFGVGLWLFTLSLQGLDLVNDPIQNFWRKDILRCGADDGRLQCILLDIGFCAAFFVGAAGTGIVIVFITGVAGAADALHRAGAQAAEKLAGQQIVGALIPAGTAAAGAVIGKLLLAAVEQITVDHGGNTTFNADIGILINTEIHLIGDNAQDRIFIELVTAGSAYLAGVEVSHDLSGGVPGGVLLEDIADSGSLLLIDAVMLICADVIAEGTVAAQGDALHSTFALAAAKLLGQLGTIVFCEGLHQAFQNNALGAIYDGLGGI